MAGEINASIPLGVKIDRPSSMDTATKAVGLGQSLLQNKLLGQQVQGKIAMGDAARDAVNPETGEFDGAAFLKRLAQDPRGAFQVPEAAAQAVARKLQEQQFDAGALDLSSKRWGLISNVAGSLLGAPKGPDGKPTPLTREYVTQAIGDTLVGSGMFNDKPAIEQIAGFVRTLPNDEKGIRDRLAQLWLQGHMTTEGIGLLKGTPQTIDTGGAANIIRTSPLTGESEALATLPKTLSPGEASTPTPTMVRNADGTLTPSVVTRQQFADTASQGPVATGAPLSRIGRSGSETAAPVEVFNDQKQRPEIIPSGQFVGDALPGAGGAGMAKGPALGQAEGASAAAADAVKALGELRAAAERAPTNKAQLLNIRDLVGKFTTGPKSDWVGLVAGLAQQLGVAPPKVTEGVAAREEAAKLMQQFVNNQIQTLGGSGTDAKLESSLKGAPNTHMSGPGLMGITALMLGLEDAIPAKNEAWQKWSKAGNGPETYPTFVAQFNRYYNPRVFQAQYMDEKQKATMLGNMSKDQRTQFEKDWLFAKKAGWIK